MHISVVEDKDFIAATVAGMHEQFGADAAHLVECAGASEDLCTVEDDAFGSSAELVGQVEAAEIVVVELDAGAPEDHAVVVAVDLSGVGRDRAFDPIGHDHAGCGRDGQKPVATGISRGWSAPDKGGVLHVHKARIYGANRPQVIEGRLLCVEDRGAVRREARADLHVIVMAGERDASVFERPEDAALHGWIARWVAAPVNVDGPILGEKAVLQAREIAPDRPRVAVGVGVAVAAERHIIAVPFDPHADRLRDRPRRVERIGMHADDAIVRIDDVAADIDERSEDGFRRRACRIGRCAWR
ncbi:MAG: hypothetical protein DI623_11400 [Sphingomonas sanxanigenens]|uniref:Uncharacterized protein n=1 Tax=Sphingomonas sanxanigenens TaxID=397260 RepID=A0A2W5A770_9SPHN|nr:MAG: hypothetical protein DI623_11400 [Sphingomonas sanxanigenens]